MKTTRKFNPFALTLLLLILGVGSVLALSVPLQHVPEVGPQAIFHGISYSLASLRAKHSKHVDEIKHQAIFRGVSYSRVVRSSPRPLTVYVVTVDTQAPDVHFLITPPDDPTSNLPLPARTTSEFLKDCRGQVAVNGDFFFPYHPDPHQRSGVEGYASSNGRPYGFDERRWQHPALCISSDNRADIRVIRKGEPVPFNAIGGDRILLQDGQVTKAARLDQHLNPRTAAGIDKYGTKMFLVVVDGRQPGYSEGMTLEELARFLQERGAFTAINFDGGGSSTLSVQGPDNLVKHWNIPIDNWIPGTERPVANHLAVFAKSL